MTGIAIDRRVRAKQWKAIVMLLDLLRLHCPAANRMTLFTISPELAAVNVGMTLGAEMPDIREDWFGMALRASDTLM